MTTYEVRLSEPAETDIDNIFQFLFMRDPRRAETWRVQLTEAVESLSVFPRRCSFAPENGRFDREIRQFWFGSRQSVYRLVYTVIEEPDSEIVVRILRVRHHAQDPLAAEDSNS